MSLLFFEAAFSICLGCKIFELVMKKNSKYCPGGSCEINIKEPIQTFSLPQKIILITTTIVMFYGIDAYITKVPDRTKIMKKMKMKMMTQTEINAIKAAKEKAIEDAFFNDDE